jgi:RNA polymerase sigma-70 factor (ECF subfamily)
MERVIGARPVAEQNRPEGGDDADLVRACVAGAPEAFRELLARYRRSALALAYQMLGNAEDAEDVAQEAFIRVFQAIPQFRQQAAFSTWLYRIVTNLCLGRQRRRRPVVALEAIAEPSSEGIPSEQVTEDLIARQVLWELPPAMRAVLVLREQEGLSYQEIAAALDVPLGTVRSRLSKARIMFRNRWNELAEEG